MKSTSYRPDSMFASLFEKYETLVRAIVSRYLHNHIDSVDDCVQQVWLECWNYCQQGKDVGKYWLEARAASRAMNLRKQLNNRPISLEEMAEAEELAGTENDNSLVDRLQLAAQTEGADCELDPRVRDYVSAAVDDLSEPLRLVVEGHYYANKSLQDLALELHIPLGTVKRRLHDAREQLRSRFMPSEEVA